MERNTDSAGNFHARRQAARKKLQKQAIFLRAIAKGKIPCFVCGKHIKSGTGHCGIITVMSNNPFIEK